MNLAKGLNTLCNIVYYELNRPRSFKAFLKYTTPIVIAVTLIDHAPLERKIKMEPVEIKVNLTELRARTELEQRYLEVDPVKVYGNDYAVLVVGKPDDEKDQYVFRRNAAMMERLLNEQGYRTVTMDSSSTSESTVYSMLAAMEELIGEEDRFVFLFTGHGAKVGSRHHLSFSGKTKDCKGAAICDDGKIYEKELLGSLNRIKGTKTLIIGSCYSGGFSDYAKKSGFDGSLLVSASKDKKSYYLSGVGLSYMYLVLLENYKDAEGVKGVSELTLNSMVLDPELRVRLDRAYSLDKLDRIRVESVDDHLF